MKCHKTRRLLPDYIGDELTSRHKERVERHLESCPQCQKEFAVYKKMWDVLKDQPIPPQDEGFWNLFTSRVMDEVTRRSRSSRKLRIISPPVFKSILIPLAGIAAVMLAFIVANKWVHWQESGGELSIQEEIAVTQIAQCFSVTPTAMADSGQVFRGIVDLVDFNLPVADTMVVLRDSEDFTISEAMTQLLDEENISVILDELNDRELEDFEKLLTLRYS